jgi:DNA-3-methyladenine glycosylase II
MDSGFLRLRTVAGVEVITQTTYTRSFALSGYRGVITAAPDTAASTLNVTLSEGLLPVADLCLQRLSQLFDLDCTPQIITEALGDVGAARPACGFLAAWTRLNRRSARF